eukprot:TRINITY_DN4911_c0_g1_i1.p1 TRINITY_DN4911_c0_g1~~TRINITY_DN4911_c0_g1_i1.p1  ORF type:complete len:359 (+),score=30.08 TRINITY_DN4911_c0_g1_i1:1-1077(+)
MATTWIHVVPDEILGSIFSFLSNSVYQIRACALTCSRWNTVSWRYLHSLDLGVVDGRCTDTVVERMRLGSPLMQCLSLAHSHKISRRSAQVLAALPLHTLNISCCSLVDDEFLLLLSKSSTLKSLVMDFCMRVSGLSFVSLTKLNLVHLSIKGAPLVRSEFHGSVLPTYQSLTYLDVSESSPCPDFFKWISNLYELKTLKLAGIGMEDTNITEFTNLENLTELDLSDNNLLTYNCLYSIQAFSKLKKLNLKHICKGIQPPIIFDDSLSVLYELESVDFFGVGLLDDWVNANIVSEKMREINLGLTGCNSCFYDFHLKYPHLEKLEIRGCDINSYSFVNISAIRNLRVIDVSFCNKYDF